METIIFSSKGKESRMYRRRMTKKAGTDEKKMMCSNCANATPVMDRWLAIGTNEPTLARCVFSEYLVLWHGRCQEKKSKWKEKSDVAHSPSSPMSA